MARMAETPKMPRGITKSGTMLATFELARIMAKPNVENDNRAVKTASPSLTAGPANVTVQGMMPHQTMKYVGHHHGAIASHCIEGEPSRAGIAIVFEENGHDIAEGGLVGAAMAGSCRGMCLLPRLCT